MAFLTPSKPKSSSSSTPSSSYEGERPLAQSTVTSCLYLKPNGSRDAAANGERSLDKAVVLRRIRHRKRVNMIRSALQSLLRASPQPGEKERDADGWLDDAFSSP